MRKILTVFVLLVCLTTAIFAVGCKTTPVEAKEMTFASFAKYEYTGSFSGNAADWLDAIAAADEKVAFALSGDWVTSVSYNDVTIQNEDGAYLGIYINVDDKDYSNYVADPVAYDGETFYASALMLSNLPIRAGMKVLFVLTSYQGEDWEHPVVSNKKALLFSYVGESK